MTVSLLSLLNFLSNFLLTSLLLRASLPRLFSKVYNLKRFQIPKYFLVNKNVLILTHINCSNQLAVF